MDATSDHKASTYDTNTGNSKRKAYLRAAKLYHPDKGGSQAAFTRAVHEAIQASESAQEKSGGVPNCGDAHFYFENQDHGRAVAAMSQPHAYCRCGDVVTLDAHEVRDLQDSMQKDCCSYVLVQCASCSCDVPVHLPVLALGYSTSERVT